MRVAHQYSNDGDGQEQHDDVEVAMGDKREK